MKTRMELEEGGYSGHLRILVYVQAEWVTCCCLWFGENYPIQTESQARYVAEQILAAIQTLMGLG